MSKREHPLAVSSAELSEIHRNRVCGSIPSLRRWLEEKKLKPEKQQNYTGLGSLSSAEVFVFMPAGAY